MGVDDEAMMLLKVKSVIKESLIAFERIVFKGWLMRLDGEEREEVETREI